jgi:hypothetical protein
MTTASHSLRDIAALGLLVSPLVPRTSSLSASQPPATSAPPGRHIIPPRFEANRGQADPDVLYANGVLDEPALPARRRCRG